MLKVLCLCGYTQSASIFRGRLGVIRKGCASSASFDFIDPPHIVHSVNLPDGSLVQYDSTAGTGSDVDEADRPRAWWFAKDQPGKEGEKRYEGLEETWALLKDTLEKEKYDVVLGFSQGAALAGALASRLTLPESGINHPPFKLAILVSGFAMSDTKVPCFLQGKGESPAETLHIIGKGDTIVSMERCQSLIDKFEDPVIEFHEGGHFVPSKANFRRYFKALFEGLDSSEGDWREVTRPSASASSGASTPLDSGRSTPVPSSIGKL